MIGNIIAIVASVLGIYATYWIGKQAKMWIERYKRDKDSGTIEDDRKAISEDAKKQDAEKDRLDDIENGFAKKGGS